MFSFEFCNIFRNTFFTQHLRETASVIRKKDLILEVIVLFVSILVHIYIYAHMYIWEYGCIEIKNVRKNIYSFVSFYFCCIFSSNGKRYGDLGTVFPQKMSGHSTIFRSSRPEVFCKKGNLKYSTELTGKTPCQSPFYDNGAFYDKGGGLKPATLLKKRLRQRCFPVNFAEHLWCMFLDISLI